MADIVIFLAIDGSMSSSTHELNKRIGRRIAEKRKARGLTQAYLAEAMGISNDAISRMERGGIMPSIPRLIQLSELLECETAEFLTHASPTTSDQTQRLATLLSKLPEHERESFLFMVDAMIAWHIQAK